MNFKEVLAAKKFVVLSEIQPPKGIDLKELLENAECLRGRVDGINVPDLPSATMRLSSLASSHLLKEKGFLPVYQLSCRDRNRLALQSDLLSASALGIENILILSGEDISLGDHPEAKVVRDLDELQLLSTAKRLQEGYDLAGNELMGRPKFCVGSLLNAGAKEHVLELEIRNMEKKIQEGVSFFETSAVFDLRSFEKFMLKVKGYGVPIIAGIIPLKSVGMAQFINKYLKDVFVREDQMEKIQKAADKIRAGIELAAELIKGLKELSQGIHIIPYGLERKVPAILDAAGL